MKQMKILLKWIEENNPSTSHIIDKIKLMITEEKPSRKFVAPILNDVVEYFVSNGYKAEIGQKAFKYYSASQWKDSRGKQIVNWKQKMVGVWFKEENKIPKQNRLGHPVMSDYYTYEDYEKALNKYKQQLA
jgi:hypothetical protein